MGLEAGLATPALAEHGSGGGGLHPEHILAHLQRAHGVCWSVASLRTVLAGVVEGIKYHRQDAQLAHVLKLFELPRSNPGVAASRCWRWVVTG